MYVRTAEKFFLEFFPNKCHDFMEFPQRFTFYFAFLIFTNKQIGIANERDTFEFSLVKKIILLERKILLQMFVCITISMTISQPLLE